MKYGFTTGSCSAAAAKAQHTCFKWQGKRYISIQTPKGLVFKPEIVDIKGRRDRFPVL